MSAWMSWLLIQLLNNAPGETVEQLKDSCPQPDLVLAGKPADGGCICLSVSNTKKLKKTKPISFSFPLGSLRGNTEGSGSGAPGLPQCTQLLELGTLNQQTAAASLFASEVSEF